MFTSRAFIKAKLSVGQDVKNLVNKELENYPLHEEENIPGRYVYASKCFLRRRRHQSISELFPSSCSEALVSKWAIQALHVRSRIDIPFAVSMFNPCPVVPSPSCIEPLPSTSGHRAIPLVMPTFTVVPAGTLLLTHRLWESRERLWVPSGSYGQRTLLRVQWQCLGKYLCPKLQKEPGARQRVRPEATCGIEENQGHREGVQEDLVAWRIRQVILKYFLPASKTPVYISDLFVRLVQKP